MIARLVVAVAAICILGAGPVAGQQFKKVRDIIVNGKAVSEEHVAPDGRVIVTKPGGKPGDVMSDVEPAKKRIETATKAREAEVAIQRQAIMDRLRLSEEELRLLLGGR